MGRILVPYPPPAEPPQDQAHPQKINYWREKVALALRYILKQIDGIRAILALPTTRTWPGFQGAPYPLLRSNRDGNGWLAWTLETTPYLLWVTTSDSVVICERLFDRWRIKAASDDPWAGIHEVSVTDPLAIIYVPQGAGDHRGKFWVSSSTSDTITTIDPFNNFATDTFALGASESNVTYLTYDADNDRVFAITGGATRICSIDPSDGSNDGQSTGWTGLTALAPTPSKLWLSQTSGTNTDKLQYLDPTDVTIAATNPGVNCSSGGCVNIDFCAGIDQLVALRGGGNIEVYLVDNAADTLVAHSLDAGQFGGRTAYIHELRCIVFGGQSTVIATDAYSCATMFAAPIGNFLSGGSMTWSHYIPEYKEMVATVDGVLCPWVFPSVLESEE